MCPSERNGLSPSGLVQFSEGQNSNTTVEKIAYNIEITVLKVIDKLMACGANTATNCWF